MPLTKTQSKINLADTFAFSSSNVSGVGTLL